MKSKKINALKFNKISLPNMKKTAGGIYEISGKTVITGISECQNCHTNSNTNFTRLVSCCGSC